eukprot:g9069.t1
MSSFDLSSLCIQTTKPNKFLEGKSTKEIDGLLDYLVDILNDVDETRKNRIKSLVALTNIARVEDQRDAVLDAVRQLNENFENALIEREEGAETFSKKSTVDEMHQLVVLLFIRVMDYAFQATDLLDLMRGKDSLALATIEISLKKVAYEDEVCLGLSRLFSGFTLPSTYFGSTGGKAMSERDCSEFSTKINMLVDKFRATPLLTTWIDAVTRRALKNTGKSSKPGTGEHFGIQQVHLEMINYGLQAFMNTYHFTTGNGATGFRQHLLVAEKVPTKLLLPVLNAIIKKYSEEESKCIGPTTILTIKTILKAFVLITFEMFSQTHTLRLDENISCDFLKNKRVQECIKEDSSIFALVLLYNVNIDSMVNETNDTDIQNEIDAISQSMNTVWEHVVTDKDRVQRLILTPGTLPVSRQTFTYRYICDMLQCDDDQYDIAEDAEESQNISRKEDDHVDEGKSSDNFRLLGNLPSLNDKKKKGGKGWKVRDNNGYHRAKKKTKKKKDKKKRTRDTAEPSRDEYPVATPVVLGLPSEFLCAINGQCLKEPMRSKLNTSLVFEKKTIEGWFERCGHVCPITSTPLKPSDLFFDEALAKQITSFMIQQSYQKNSSNFADEEDMYSF